MFQRRNARGAGRRRRAAVLVASIVAAAVATVAAPAAAETATLEDPTGDVVTSETETPITEPRVDITEVVVVHETRLLAITIKPVQFVPLDDPLWSDGSIGMQALLTDPDSSDPFGSVWIWDVYADLGGEMVAELISFTSDLEFCPTDIVADEAAGTYTLSTGPECLRDVPRQVSITTAMGFDAAPFDDDYDTPFDQGPDALSDPIGADGAPDVTRLAGPDRVETAIALSVDQFEAGTAGAAVLASAADFPDAIAGGPLAAHYSAPLLLTGGMALDERVTAELERAVEPGSAVYLLGGTGALSETISGELRALGYRPKRLAGTNRFETAVAVADEIGDHAMTLIADGRSFQDGLIAGAAAASLGGVVVLSDGNTLPKATDDFVAADPTRHIALGIAATAAPGAERITAASTPELSQKVLDRLLPDANLLAVAGTATFADALAGASHAASLGGGLLLSDSTTLSPAVAAELGQRKAEVREIVLYGGTASLSASVEAAIVAALS